MALANARGVLTTTAATIYTAPATGAQITQIQLCNTSASPVDVTVQWLDSSAANAVTRLCRLVTLAAYESISVQAGGLILASGDAIQAFASVTTVVEATVSAIVPLMSQQFTKVGPGMSRISKRLSLAGGGLPKLGDIVEGGAYFGHIQYGGNQYMLITAPAANELTAAWKTADTADTAGSYHDGAANTILYAGVSYPAANHCAGLSLNGFTDWYLPASFELSMLMANLRDAANFPGTAYDLVSGGNYWSSTPVGTGTQAIFYDDYSLWTRANQSNKTTAVYIARPIRRVQV